MDEESQAARSYVLADLVAAQSGQRAKSVDAAGRRLFGLIHTPGGRGAAGSKAQARTLRPSVTVWPVTLSKNAKPAPPDR